LSARSCHDLRTRKWGWKGVLELSGWKEAKYIVMGDVNKVRLSGFPLKVERLSHPSLGCRDGGQLFGALTVSRLECGHEYRHMPIAVKAVPSTFGE
jgi:hypothetical protein